MRKWLNIVLSLLLLAGGAVLCAVRWQAWFGMPPEPQWEGETADYRFPAVSDSLPLGEDGVLTFIVLGDIHNRLAAADYDSIAARVPQADAVAQTGDWLDRGQDYYYQALMHEWTGSALYGLPVIACPGNHEYTKGLHRTLSPVWDYTFAHPCSGITGVPGVDYYTDLPGMRLIVLDTNPLTRMVYLTRTLTWLRGVIDSAGERYTVVLMHHPVLSPAKGRVNILIYTAFRHVLGDADLVIAGHDHSYMRRTPFVVLNSAGRPKTQRMRFVPERTDTAMTYGVLAVKSQEHRPQMTFTVCRMSDGFPIDTVYVSHD